MNKQVIATVVNGDNFIKIAGELDRELVTEDEIVLHMPDGTDLVLPKDDLLTVKDVVVPLPKVEKAKKEKVVVQEGELKPLKEGSKLAQVVELCKANPNATRKELIALIVEKVGMTPAGASTYHQNAKPYLA